MEIVSLGRSGLRVSKLCMGTMTFGSSKWKRWVLDEDESRPVLKRALDHGINFFDLADWYSIGESERLVGKLLLSMVPRDNLVLTTKACYAMSDDPNDRGLSRKHLFSAIDGSLSRIGTNYVDIFMIHSFDPHTPVEETMEALNDIVKAGKARYLGASTLFAWQLAKMNHIARERCLTEFINMQCQYNLLYREEEREMIPYCLDQGIGVTCFSPLARGWLAGAKDVRSETDPSFTKMFGDRLDRMICAEVETIAKEQGVSMARVAFAWLLSKPYICCPIIGPASKAQMQDYVEALEFDLLDSDIERLDGLYRPRDVINDHVANPMPRHLGGIAKDVRQFAQDAQ